MKMRRRYRSTASQSPSRRILVVGAGPVGLRCAIGAALAGNRVAVIEQHESEARARFLGLFPPEQQYLAAIGAPKRMFCEVSVKGAPKRAVTLPDLQIFLKAIARKVGVEIWMQSRAIFEKNRLQAGAIQCVFCPSALSPASPRFSQMVCLNGKQSSGMGQKQTLNFDMIVDATGAHSDLKQTLFEKRIVGFRTLGKDAILFEGSDAAVYHAKGAPPGVSFPFDQENQTHRWSEFVEKTMQGHADIRDTIGCFVGNIDRFVFNDKRSLDLSDHCPPDWLWKPIPRPTANGPKPQERRQQGASGGEHDIFRLQFEGPFPQRFNGSRTVDWLHRKKRTPTDIIAAFIQTAGAAADIHQANWNRYCSIENGSQYPVQNTAAWFTCQLTGVQTVPDTPSLWGVIPGSRGKEYFIAGDAAQSPWYRFGVGILDGFYSASIFDELLRNDKTEKERLVARWERYLRQRAVQVLYAVYIHQQLLKKDLFMDKMLKRLNSDHPLTF
jgi:flavin-dependent dehydrogenase